MSINQHRAGRRARRVLAVLAVAVGGLGLGAGVASAEFGLRADPGNPSGVDFMADAFDATGDPFTQAGGYPYEAKTTFAFNLVDDGRGNQIPEGNAKDIILDLPAGLAGNPQSVATCDNEQFSITMPNGLNACPVNSQIGKVRLELYNAGDWIYETPIYNMRPNPDEVAAFQFSAITVTVRAVASVRTDGDYGLRVAVRDINETVGIKRVEFSLWGVPADPIHDPDRQHLNIRFNGIEQDFGGNVPAGATPRPFFINPVTCDHGRYTTTLSTRSWQNPSAWKSYSTPTVSGVTGCGNLKWEPSVRVQPDNTKAGAPTGLNVDIDVPQSSIPQQLQTPELKKAVVQLPAGMRVSPSSATGLGGCSDAQIAIGSFAEPTCPDSSNLGTVRIDTPLLADPLVGNIYLGTQKPDQLLRLFIVARGRGNLLLKLPGKVDPDPITGQLLATFDNNPQLPFSRLSLHFKGGARAALSNPVSCGVKTTSTELTAWSGHVAKPSDSFTITHDGNGAPCPPLGFAPTLRAGTTHATAGADSTFTLTFARGDYDQEFKDLTVDLPAGLLGRIANVELCNDAAANAGTCGESSRIGSVMTAAGPGTNPYYLPGKGVYITGPYKGAPFGMSIVVPALAGPFDLGTVVVRAAIHVDRRTAQLRVVSDPLPSILMGIPLQIRSVNIAINRPRFMFNPTSCNPTSVRAQVGSTAGATANVSSRFQVADCSSLPYKPKLTMRIGARGRTKRDLTSPLAVTLNMTPGQANNRSVMVTLPDTVNARLPVVNRACSYTEFRTGRCERARIGSAVAVTPLLRDPLRGPAYFVRHPDRRLPDLMVDLRGQVEIELTGKVTIPGGRRLATNFDTIPDVPITKFTLNLVSGRNGPVGNVKNLCLATTQRVKADLRFRAHSGKLVTRAQRMRFAGCGKKAGQGRRASGRARRGGRSRGGARRAARSGRKSK